MTLQSTEAWGHDAAVSRELFRQLLHDKPQGYWIISNTAFPTSEDMQGRILTPPKANFDDYPADPDECRRFIAFCEELVSARQPSRVGDEVFTRLFWASSYSHACRRCGISLSFARSVLQAA
jgi:hypothetical protein